MKTSNQSNAAARNSESGHVWREKLTNALGTLEVLKYATIRVRATGATTVTIDGDLAMTMSAGEVEYFNAGIGNQNDKKATVTILIGGVAAFVQVADDSIKRKQ